MKRFLLFIVLISIVVSASFFLFKFTKERVKRDFSWSVPNINITPTPFVNRNRSNDPETKSLFVPYWSLKDSIGTDYDEYIYFGIAPDLNGIDLKEQGARNLDSFLGLVPKDKKKLLALRMIDSDTNFAILKDSKKQDTIINQTISIAKQNKFDGIVLDLEVTAIPFESLVKQITDFNAAFYKKAKNNDLEFAITIYGDVFYRVRPFDVKTLAKNSDRILIMAYDFSKAKGNPGPNFPLLDSDTYGYDMTKMVTDFAPSVPMNKVTVVFGLFGYDWQVDSQGRTLSQAKALSSKEIEKNFIETCQASSCSFGRNSKTVETEIKYTAKNGTKHIIWFEDMDSVAAKKEFLKTQGISSFSYWAHSYF